ncbi:MAG TPA: N-acetylneuraminate synthase family protein [Terriglobales bacterium]|nr:N-acetylneuraminate synthase family protein [Terriglobales bacterium]
MNFAARPYTLIAEIGVNHENNLETAKRLIELAKEGGAHSAKFQAYKAGTLASRNSPAYWDTTKETTKSQFDLFRKHDAFDMREYKVLAEHCGKVGIDFSCTAFDLRFLDEIDPLVSFHKVASADLTVIPFLRKVGSKRKPVALSTGAASLEEVELAIRTLQESGSGPISLLHCNLNYPTPDGLAFLNRVAELKQKFPGQVPGYSDHTVPNDGSLAVVTAFVLGAKVIEKHFTHDKTLPGNDHYHAGDVRDFRRICEQLDQCSKFLASYDESTFLGCQEKARQFARRSLVASRDVKRDEPLTDQNVTWKRPGTGLDPRNWDRLMGKKAARDIAEDTVLTNEDVVWD